MNPAVRAVVDEAVEHFQTAIARDCSGDFQLALTSYIDGVSLLLQVAKDGGVSIAIQEVLRVKCKEYLARVQTIRDHTEKGEDVPANNLVDKLHTNLADFDEDTREVLCSFGDVRLKLSSLDDFHGVPECKEFLEKNVILPLRFPGQLDKITKVKRGILLYGLPGTGKTALIGTVLSSVACPFLRIPSSDLCCLFYGIELTLKLVHNIFEWAKKNQPCILCFEDLDVLCEPEDDRADSIRKQTCDKITSLLQNYSPDNQVTVIGSTQKPWRLNSRLVRKFDRRFLLTLPTLDERIAIFKQSLTGINPLVYDAASSAVGDKHELRENDFKTIGQKTENFTGADLVVLVRDCAMQPVRQLQSATHYKKVVIIENKGTGHETRREMLTPCAASDSGAIEITWEFLNMERVVEPSVTMSVVERCLEKCAPSCSEEEMLKMMKWASEYGQD